MNPDYSSMRGRSVNETNPKGKIISGYSLMGGRWDLRNEEQYKEKIIEATIIAWNELIDIDDTYEYTTIMKCAHHLIGLFIEDYPDEYGLTEIALVALKLAHIQLSQGITEDFSYRRFYGRSYYNYRSELKEIEFKMMEYPYHRCLSVMETELKSPEDAYEEALDTLKIQVGDRYRSVHIKTLERNMIQYYNDLLKQPFFEEQHEEYVPIGGSPTPIETMYDSNRQIYKPVIRVQPSKPVYTNYPPYLERDETPVYKPTIRSRPIQSGFYPQ